jgi:hypothetical protein
MDRCAGAAVRLLGSVCIANAGQGLRAGLKAAWDDTPCHGDVFHIQHQYETLANTLSRLAKGAASWRKKLSDRIGRASQSGPDETLSIQSEQVRQTETQAYRLARDIRTLTRWLSHDALTLAGPALAARQELLDFIVEELAQREPKDVRIRPLRVAPPNAGTCLRLKRARPLPVPAHASAALVRCRIDAAGGPFFNRYF